MPHCTSISSIFLKKISPRNIFKKIKIRELMPKVGKIFGGNQLLNFYIFGIIVLYEK